MQLKRLISLSFVVIGIAATTIWSTNCSNKELTLGSYTAILLNGPVSGSGDDPGKAATYDLAVRASGVSATPLVVKQYGYITNLTHQIQFSGKIIGDFLSGYNGQSVAFTPTGDGWFAHYYGNTFEGVFSAFFVVIYTGEEPYGLQPNKITFNGKFANQPNQPFANLVDTSLTFNWIPSV